MLSIASLFIVAGYPILIIKLYFTDVEQLKSDRFTRTVGVVYEDLDLREDTSSLKWPLFLTLYKVVFVYTLVFVRHQPVAQLILLDWIFVFYLIVVG